jgi:hypothetical protein
MLDSSKQGSLGLLNILMHHGSSCDQIKSLCNWSWIKWKTALSESTLSEGKFIVCILLRECIKSTQFQPSTEQFFTNLIPLHVSTPLGHLHV